eukprot:TRINITY_DN166975_c0_g1_i1.p2 TRINITY_DN166975_c0_g1~~TRINITY_DN166975_c0_g1_i1.p2  ORF type:complete len:171 (-),score=15.65 TRINITY_DN166975_c0_g1_i1:1217-1729(-)
MYKFGKSSTERLREVHELLQLVAKASIQQSTFDFGIPSTGGLRTAEQQKKLFDRGVSQRDGVKKKSYHQYGMALDLIPYINGGYTWSNREAFLVLAKTVFEAWDSIEDTQGLHLHWGGFWRAKDLNNNSSLDLEDKLGWDLGHFELRTRAQKNTMPIRIIQNNALQNQAI